MLFTWFKQLPDRTLAQDLYVGCVASVPKIYYAKI
jgi:hypothetical protein